MVIRRRSSFVLLPALALLAVSGLGCGDKQADEADNKPPAGADAGQATGNGNQPAANAQPVKPPTGPNGVPE